MSEIHKIRSTVPGLHLNEEFLLCVVGIDKDVAPGEIGSKPRRVVRRYSMHPALSDDRRFTYAPM